MPARGAAPVGAGDSHTVLRIGARQPPRHFQDCMHGADARRQTVAEDKACMHLHAHHGAAGAASVLDWLSPSHMVYWCERGDGPHDPLVRFCSAGSISCGLWLSNLFCLRAQATPHESSAAPWGFPQTLQQRHEASLLHAQAPARGTTGHARRRRRANEMQCGCQGEAAPRSAHARRTKRQRPARSNEIDGAGRVSGRGAAGAAQAAQAPRSGRIRSGEAGGGSRARRGEWRPRRRCRRRSESRGAAAAGSRPEPPGCLCVCVRALPKPSVYCLCARP